MAKDKEKKKKVQLPEHLELQRTSVECGAILNKHVSNSGIRHDTVPSELVNVFTSRGDGG